MATRRGTGRALGTLVVALAGVLAAAGLLATTAYVVLASPAGRAWLTPRLLALANDAIRGRIEVRGFAFQDGGLVLREVAVRDPDGEVVLSARRAFAAADLTRLRARHVGVRIELDQPFVLAAKDDRGEYGVARAFQPRRPSPRKEEPSGPATFTVEVTRLVIQGGEVRVEDADGARQLWIDGLRLDLAGEHGPAGSRLATRASAALRAPAEQPLALEASASLRQGFVRVPLLRAKVGDTAIDLVGEGDLATRKGRAALLSFAVGRDATRAFAPRAPLAGDLAGAAYAESDGEVAAAALHVAPAGGSGGGVADAAAALRMRGPLAAGADVAFRSLDPSRLVSGAPPGDVTLTARGRVLGDDPRSLAGALLVRVEPSRLRGSRLGPIDLRATARDGTYVAEKLDAAIPGARLTGSGRWSFSGAVGGRARLDAPDVAAALAAVTSLSGAKLPPITGRVRAELSVAGRADAPELKASIDAPRIAASGVAADGVRVDAALAGPFRAPRASVEGAVGELRAGGRSARDVAVRGTFDGQVLDASLRGLVRELGAEPVTLAVRGTLDRPRSAFELAALSFSWPGTRFDLARPARLTLAGPSVDRLELVSGPQRIAMEGGLVAARRGRRTVKLLDARLAVERFELARLPPGLLPDGLGLAGALSASAAARGEPAAPVVDGRLELADGEVRGVTGLSVAADATYDAPARRIRASVGLRRAAGGEAELRVDLPSALLAAPATAPLNVHAEVRALPVADALRIARSEAALDGFGDGDLTVTGTVARPAVTLHAALSEASSGTYGPFALRAFVEDSGTEASVDLSADWRGARALDLGGVVPLDTGELLHSSERALRKLRTAPVDARLFVPNLDLRLLAGVGGLPADLAGNLVGDGTIKGTLLAPRGELGLEATGLAGAGWKGADARVIVALGDGVTAVRGRAAFGGAELVQLQASLFAPIEALARPGAFERAQFDLDAVLPGAPLEKVSGQTPLSGTLKGNARASGTLAEPQVEVALRGDALAVSSKPLGDLEVRASAGRAGLDLEARLAAARGGLLRATLQSAEPVSLEALRAGRLWRAEAVARLTADRVDLGFLPAALPGTVRSASGTLGADLVARGPLTRMRPQGTLHVAGGQAAIAELGDWNGIEVDAIVSEDALRIDRLEAHRGGGLFTGTAEAKGLLLRDGPGQFTASARARSLAIARAGQDVVTLEDVEANAKGTFDASTLRADVTVPKAAIRLPRRSPRPLQTLDRREDIIVGVPKKKARRHGEALAPGEQEEAKPYRVVVHAVAPNRLFVRSNDPRVDLELKADTTFDVIGNRTYAEGSVEVIRGEVEPIGGRRFEVERGRVTFTGGEPSDAVLDVVARYDNPSAKVTVNISGPTSKPSVKMTSEPPMDEAQIAMLIATGRTELKAGGGGVGTLTGEEAGKAALGVVATQVFKNLVADKLPLDTVALDSSQIRAGKYLTDKIYVGYTRSFDAQLEKGENQNEVRVQYQISPRWTFESRYGDGKSGGASIIWSKDY